MVDEDPPSSYQSLSEMIEHMRSKNEAEVRIMAENIYTKIELKNWVGEAIERGDDFANIPMQHFENRGEDHFCYPADWVNYRHTQFLGDITWADVYDSLKDRICAEGIECEIIYEDYDEDEESDEESNEEEEPAEKEESGDGYGKISEIRIRFPRTRKSSLKFEFLSSPPPPPPPPKKSK